jgi:hypothetical protein
LKQKKHQYLNWQWDISLLLLAHALLMIVKWMTKRKMKAIDRKTYNHSSMSTHVEIIISWMHNFCVDNCPCRGKFKIKCSRVFVYEYTGQESSIPGGTFSRALAWNSFIWWFFCATITVNLGTSTSSRYL